MSRHNLDSARSEEDAKVAVIGKPWGAEVGGSLWYDIGPGGFNRLSPAERQEIIDTFFVSGGRAFDDIEVSEEPPTTTLLRLRGNLRLQPSFKFRGRDCPLRKVQIGAEEPIVF